jgi:hypothetical protein
MIFLVGDKLKLNILFHDKEGFYPPNLEATVLEYGAGAMYKLKLSTGEIVEWSEPMLARIFMKKPFKNKNEQ